MEVSGLEHLPGRGPGPPRRQPRLLLGHGGDRRSPPPPKRPIHALAKSELVEVPRARPDPQRDGADPRAAQRERRRRLRASGRGPPRRGLHRRLPGGHALARPRAAGAQRLRAARRPRARGGGRARLHRRHDDDRRRLPDEAAEDPRALLPARGRAEAAGRERGSEFSARLLEEIRREAPRVACGRKGEIPPMPDDPREVDGCGRPPPRSSSVELVDGAVARVLVLAPALHLRPVPDPPPARVVEGDLDHELGPQRDPLEVAVVRPPARLARAALAGLVGLRASPRARASPWRVKPDEWPTSGERAVLGVEPEDERADRVLAPCRAASP